MSRYDLDSLILKVCGRSGGTWSVCTKFDRNQTTPGWVIHNLANFCSSYVSLWPWLWPLDLELLWSFGHHVFKLCVKVEQNRTICCRVTDDLAYYRREIFEWVVFTRKDLRGVWTEFHQTWRGHTSIISVHPVRFRVEISCCIFKCGPIKDERHWT